MGGERACARSGQQRVRRSTASKMSGSGEESTTRSDVVRPFPDIVKQIVFKIEKLTERVRRPKAPAALPQSKICHLLTRCSV